MYKVVSPILKIYTSGCYFFFFLIKNVFSRWKKQEKLYCCHDTPSRRVMHRATFMLSREPHLNILIFTHVFHTELLDEGAGRYN